MPLILLLLSSMLLLALPGFAQSSKRKSGAKRKLQVADSLRLEMRRPLAKERICACSATNGGCAYSTVSNFKRN